MKPRLCFVVEGSKVFLISHATWWQQVRVEELFNGVCVPLVDGQRLHHLALLVHQLDDGVGASHIPLQNSMKALEADKDIVIRGADPRSNN